MKLACADVFVAWQDDNASGRPYRLCARNDFVTLASQWWGERYNAVSSSIPCPIARLLARVTEKDFTRTHSYPATTGTAVVWIVFFFLFFSFLLSLLLLVMAWKYYDENVLEFGERVREEERNSKNKIT